MGEIRAVDDQQNIGLRSRDGLRGLVDPRNELRQLLQDLREAHDGEFGIIEQRHQPLRLQRLTADTHQLDRTGIPGLERADQIRAEKIAGYLAGDNRHFNVAVMRSYPRQSCLHQVTYRCRRRICPPDRRLSTSHRDQAQAPGRLRRQYPLTRLSGRFPRFQCRLSAGRRAHPVVVCRA